MSRDYFSQYPKTTFKKENTSVTLPSGAAATYDVEVTDILLKFKIRDLFLSDASLFYPYRWKDGDRPDNLAHRYYGSETFHWVVFYSNGSFDYNYDFPMEESIFNRFILRKYDQTSVSGGISSGYLIEEPLLANIGVHVGKFVLHDEKFFDVRNGSPKEIAKETYIYAYLEDTIKYWETGSGVIIGKTEFESIDANNKTLSLRISDPGIPISVGSGIAQLSSSATVLDYDSINNVLVVNNVNPPINLNNPLPFFVAPAIINGTTQVNIESVLLNEFDPDARPVSIFAYEIETNEEKRNVQLLDNDYFISLVKQFRREMSLVNAQRS